ncbi:MAG: GNAT family N-acetyltransferase [Candidatus Woesearchaeota archaeon]
MLTGKKYGINKYDINTYDRSHNKISRGISKYKLKNLNKIQLEAIILNEIEEHDFQLVETCVKTYYPSELHPESYNENNFQIYVQINIATKKENNNNNNNNNNNEEDNNQPYNDNTTDNNKNNNPSLLESYLDFYYSPKHNRIEHINLKVLSPLTNKGYARKLVETMENVGRRTGCHTSRVNININKSFWEHMGYELNESVDTKCWDKKL